MKRLVLVVLLLLLVGAGGWWIHRRGQPVGFVLISIDTLRADRLGAYGYPLDTSPFFDDFAERGDLFEKAIVQLPGTLPSHMSIFTGLYPQEHGVYPPDGVLSASIATLPEMFQEAGYRTGGFTDGGYVKGTYGFARGFDVFDDVTKASPGGASETFRRAKEFVSSLRRGERFFLFVHSYEVHDPYYAEEPYKSNSWPGEPPAHWDSVGSNLAAASEGELEITPEALEYFSAMYDASIRFIDDVLRDFMEYLWAQGLSPDTTIVITSDHGEEFLEHGGLAHRQLYDETLHVPLLVRRLGQRRGGRIGHLVQSIDIAPTLVELAGLTVRPNFSGRSLVASLGDPEVVTGTEAFAEGVVSPTRTLYQSTDEGLFRFALTRYASVGDRLAVGRSLTFDGSTPELRFQVQSYHVERELEVYVNGVLVRRLQITPGRMQEVVVDLLGTAAKYRVDLEVDSCDRPSEVGTGSSRQCLGFFLSGIKVERRELFQVDGDPREALDLSSARPMLAIEMERALERYQWQPREPAEHQELSDEQVERLRALGYLQ